MLATQAPYWPSLALFARPSSLASLNGEGGGGFSPGVGGSFGETDMERERESDREMEKKLQMSFGVGETKALHTR